MAIDGMRPDKTCARRGLAINADDRAMRLHRPNRVVLADLDAMLLEQIAQRAAKLSVRSARNPQLACQRFRLQRLVILARKSGYDLFFEIWHADQSMVLSS